MIIQIFTGCPREAMEVVESLSMKVFKKMAGVALRDIVLWA